MASADANASGQQLFLVFGGELVKLDGTEFKDPSSLDVVGVFTNYDDACAAWKSAAQRSVDTAEMRYFVTLIDPASMTRPA